MKKGDLIKIYWRDVFSFGGWWEEEEIKKKIDDEIKDIETIGFFVMKYKNFIVIAQSKELSSDFSTWGHWKAIPTGIIKKIMLLKEGRN